ncbi:MAG TPA: sugar phosphate nucleotidyltransferase, partial [Ignavibacteriaceae bacterium]|nr:sugar phosphate nucleotidyltransferase [Ignavibacteriaceae bacterium]
PLVKINGVPLIQRIIDTALKNNISSIVCIINNDSEDLMKFLQNKYSSKKLKLIVKSTESSFHSLKEISQHLTPPFLISTVDSIFKEDEFRSFLEFGINVSNADVIVASTNFIDDEKPLYINLNEDGYVIDFYDSAKDYEFVTGGLYLFKREIKKEIKEAMESDTKRLRNFLRFLIRKEFRIQAYRFSKIIDVDHISDIEAAESFLNEVRE